MSDVTMPQLGETVTEGTITRWAKAVGDRVEQDEVLFEVSTDKVDSEVPSPAAGYLTQILVDEGETVDVGTRLAVISEQAPGPDGQAAAPAETAPAEAGAAEAAAAEPEPEAAEPEPEAAQPGQPPQPEASRPGLPEAAPPAEAAPSPEPEVEPRPVSGERAAPAAPAPEAGPERVLSPVVRRLLAEHRLDPSEIRGTGAGGRITRADVLDAVDSRERRGQPAPAAASAPAPSAPAPSVPAIPAAPAPAAPTGPSGPAIPAAPAAPAGRPTAPFAAPTGGPDDEVIPFTNIRRRTAEHMVRSKATSAHTFTAIEVDFHAVDAARAVARDAFRQEEGFSLSYLPFIARAVCDAIREYPRVNASVGEDQLIVHRRINLGVAVDLDLEGLIVPVVRDTDSKRLRAIAREIRDLAERARSRRLGADEISSGTFTISNPGPFGTMMTVPIINQPQVAILSTDGVKRRPVVVDLPDGGEAIVIHPVGLLGLSYDHRAIDGAYASAFLAKLREIIETRDWAQEL